MEASFGKLKIEYIPLASVKPYAGNAKLHPVKQVEQIKQSILEMGNGDPLKGFKDPIGIWNGEIVEGHGRYMAARLLGMETVPVIRLDDLTDEQRRAYTLIHNQLTMNSGLDLETMAVELENIQTIGMEDYGFEIDAPIEIETDETEDDYEPAVPRSMQNDAFENQEILQFSGVGFYGIPEMEATSTTGDKMWRFMDWKDCKDPENYIAHFYYDDYRFMQAWRNPDRFVDKLRRFKAVVSPDFSLYTDFPRALQILSCYRRQWVGAYWQLLGLDVIPDVVWGDKESFAFCFDGIPQKSTVAVSTVGVKRDKEWNNEKGDLFRAGYDEMMNRLEPTTILFYGDMIDGLDGNIIHIPPYYEERRKMLNARQEVKKHGARK